jgi:hypothetical protein
MIHSPILRGDYEQSLLAERRSDDAVPAVYCKDHGVPRVDDRRLLSGIIFINRIGLRWCDALKEYESLQDAL